MFPNSIMYFTDYNIISQASQSFKRVYAVKLMTLYFLSTE